MPFPNANSIPLYTLIGRTNVMQIIPDGGNAVFLSAKKLVMNPKVEHRKRKGIRGGVWAVDRIVRSACSGECTAKFDEYPEDVIELLTNAHGKCEFAAYALDPGADTQYGAMRMESETYGVIAGLAELDGDFVHERDEFGEYGIKFTAKGEVKFTADRELLQASGDPGGAIFLTMATVDESVITYDDAAGVGSLPHFSATAVDCENMTNRLRLLAAEKVTYLLVASAAITDLRVTLGGMPRLEGAYFPDMPELKAVRCDRTNVALTVVNVQGCGLTAAALDALYASLPDRTGMDEGTVTVTGNPGTGTDTPAIAVAKNWVVTG
jgi:hypothetical protein